MRYVALSSDEYDQYKADPKYVAEQRFYAILDKQFPLLATYQPAAVGQLTVFEIPSIWNAVANVVEVAHGGLSGPTIKIYEIPADRR
jgi:hypothetical protein